VPAPRHDGGLPKAATDSTRPDCSGLGSGPLATGALILNDALGFGTPGTMDDAGVMPGGAPSPMLLAFTEDIVAEFPNQPGRASWQLNRSAVLEWVTKWRAKNDANGEANPET
jgi:hypothetical protein